MCFSGTYVLFYAVRTCIGKIEIAVVKNAVHVFVQKSLLGSTSIGRQ